MGSSSLKELEKKLEEYAAAFPDDEELVIDLCQQIHKHLTEIKLSDNRRSM